MIAATHVRLAAIHDDNQNGEQTQKGMMRSATSSITRKNPNASEAQPTQLSWAQWDSVDFTATSGQHYPALDGAALTNLPLPDFISDATTLLPPLMHVLAWASRPGEMATTQWEYEELSKDADGFLSRRGLPCTVALRRSRAQAGRYESVRLLDPVGEPAQRQVLGRRLHQINQELEQALGISPLPKNGAMNAVLSNRETFFVSHTREVAAQEPALVFTQLADGPFTTLQPLRISLFADPAFRPDSIPNPPQPDLRSEMYLFAAVSGTQPPEEYPDNGQPPASPDVLVLRKIPQLADHFWKPEPSADSPQCFSASIGNLHVLLQPITSASTIEVLSFRYVYNPLTERFVREREPMLAISIVRLDPSAAFLLPKMSVTLLGIDDASGDAHVAGYGRLNSSNFTLPTYSIDISTNSTIKWVRYARLTALDRRASDQFDVVVYGAGGEPIPTRA